MYNVQTQFEAAVSLFADKSTLVFFHFLLSNKLGALSRPIRSTTLHFTGMVQEGECPRIVITTKNRQATKRMSTRSGRNEAVHGHMKDERLQGYNFAFLGGV